MLGGTHGGFQYREESVFFISDRGALPERDVLLSPFVEALTRKVPLLQRRAKGKRPRTLPSQTIA